MVNNFETWRKATMSRFSGSTISHYHKCEDFLLRVIIDRLRKIIIARVNYGQRLTIQVDDEFADAIIPFIEQMTMGYLHPRCDSAKRLFSANPCTY